MSQLVSVTPQAGLPTVGHGWRRVSRMIAASFVAVWITLPASPASAQNRPIEIEPSGMQPPIQMGRPIPSWWDVKIKGSGLVEGRIEFQLLSDDRLLASTITEDLALTGPQQRIRVMLPATDDIVTVDQLQVRANFRGSKLKQDLGSHILRVAIPRARTFMLLTATSRLAGRRSADRSGLLSRLAFESLAPSDLGDDVKTVVNSLDPSDWPQEPLGYCSYDLVVISGDEFRQLKSSYLDPLAAWVRAGGSLYLEPSGILEPYHIEFLRRLTSADPRGLVIRPDAQGRVRPGTIWEDERLLLVPCSLGRIAIRVDEENADTSFDTPQWRRASAFLWRIHWDQSKIVGQQEIGRLQPLLPHGWTPTYDGNGNVRQRIIVPSYDPPTGGEFEPPEPSVAPMPIAWLTKNAPTSTSELVDSLMPKGVQMVPLWLLGLILFAFVVWIGPVDYVVLGQLKARKYTWLTFPLATVLVTAFTVWITNRYMAFSETRRALIVRDVGDDNSVVRTNRFELLFVASSRATDTGVRKGMFSPLETSLSLIDTDVNYRVRPYQGRRPGYGRVSIDLPEDREPTRLQGRIPTEYTATQNLAKWTPQLNRVFSIPGPTDEAVIDWKEMTDGIPVEEMFQSHLVSPELVSRVRSRFASDAVVGCLGHHGRWAHDRGAGWTSSHGQMNPSQVPPYGYYGQVDQDSQKAHIPDEVMHQPDLFRWIYIHSLAIPHGVFTLISRTGPMGGPHLNDLPILDATNPDDWLLVVIVPQGDDFVAYRKLLHLRQ